MRSGDRDSGQPPEGAAGAVQLCLDELFDHPPVNEAELKQRLKGLQRARVRRELVDRMEQGRLEESSEPLVLALFRLVGAGEQQQRLIELATAREVTPRTRFLALECLDEDTKNALGEHLHEVDPEAAQEMATAPLVDLMSSVQANPAQAEMVSLVLLSTPAAEQERMLLLLGQCRRNVGTPAAVAYRDALTRSDLEHLHEAMIDAMVKEGGQAAIGLLEALRDGAKGPRRTTLQRALLRLRTRAIEPNHVNTLPTGRAYFTGADGQGTYVLVACFDNPDGTTTAADLCIRAGGDLRDGVVLPHLQPEEADDFLGQLGERSGLELAPVTLAEAAALAYGALERTTRAGLRVPVEAAPALDLIGQVPAQSPLGPDESGTAPTLVQVRKLLQRPGYGPWFFDEGDLADALQHRPPPRKRTASWLTQAAARLEDPGVRTRLVGMARHMALWHQLRGELKPAEICARLARVTDNAFAQSPLVRVMLERGLELMERHQGEAEPMRFGDPTLRQRIKATFFSEVQSPKGRDLAHLDFTEAAYVALEDAVLDLPGHRRPRDEQLLEMAHSLGRTFANGVLAERDGHDARLVRALVRTAPLDRAECRQLAMAVLPALEEFTGTVCGRCPVQCLDKPGRKATDVFFSPDHPAPEPEPEPDEPAGDEPDDLPGDGLDSLLESELARAHARHRELSD